MPKVSVIIPVYGVEKYIERCARSLFEQTLDDIEYLFIDDCTPDKSIEVLNRVLEEYPQRKNQVIIHRMEKNSGQAAVRKWGMLNATGDYVIHCDSDDWVDVTMYEKMYNKAIEENADIVRCDFLRIFPKCIRNSVRVSDKIFRDVRSVISKLLIGSDLTSLCDKLVKRNIVQSTDITFPDNNMQEDSVFCLQYLLKCGKISYINKPFYKYCYNASSISRKQSNADYENRLHDVCKNATLICKILEQYNLFDYYNKEIIVLKYNARCHIIDLVGQGNYLNIWKNIFPDIDSNFLFNSKVPIRMKIQYITIMLHLYPIFRKYKTKMELFFY